MTTITDIPEAIKVQPLDGFKLYLEFNDGVNGTVDLSHLKGKGVFELWNQSDNFFKVHIDDCGGIAWSDKVDIDALNCYLKIINKTFEEYAGY